jgi:hypothetical protein
MATDYRQVLKELREEEVRLESELKIIRDAIPSLEMLANRIPVSHTVGASPVRDLPLNGNAKLPPYARYGTKQAIHHYLSFQNAPKMPSEITQALLEGGIVTRSTDFGGMVGTTLTQMKADGLVARVEDGWIVRT